MSFKVVACACLQPNYLVTKESFKKPPNCELINSSQLHMRDVQESEVCSSVNCSSAATKCLNGRTCKYQKSLMLRFSLRVYTAAALPKCILLLAVYIWDVPCHYVVTLFIIHPWSLSSNVLSNYTHITQKNIIILVILMRCNCSLCALQLSVLSPSSVNVMFLPPCRELWVRKARTVCLVCILQNSAGRRRSSWYFLVYCIWHTIYWDMLNPFLAY